jgi:hypothetical protein
LLFLLLTITTISLHGSGLKYEFAVSIKESKLLWINGPYPASVHDITIYRGGRKKDQKDEVWDRNSLFFAVPDGVMGVGDDGYRGEPNKIVTTRPEHSSEMKNFLGRAKNRQISRESVDNQSKPYQESRPTYGQFGRCS